MDGQRLDRAMPHNTGLRGSCVKTFPMARGYSPWGMVMVVASRNHNAATGVYIGGWHAVAAQYHITTTPINPLLLHAHDRYEGEFQAGFVHGLGQYVSPSTGELYRGEWSAGKRQGCGVLTNMNPFYKRVAAGMDPQAAWEASKDEIENNEKWGTWHGDYYVSEVDDTGKNCGYYEIK